MLRSPRSHQARGFVFGLLALVVGIALLAVSPVVAATAAPPDGRGYELVSPANKLGAIPNFPGGLSNLGFVDFGTITAASSNGQRVIWFSTGAFANATSALPMNYMSSRTPSGWTTKQLSPNPTDAHPNVFMTQARVTDATDDFSARVIASSQHYDPANTGILRADLYRQDDNGLLTWLSRPISDPPQDSALAEYDGRDATASHVLFSTLEPLDPAAAGQAGAELYDSTGGQPVLVGVDSGGAPIGNCGAVVGFTSTFATDQAFDNDVKLRAVSDDGSHIFFTTPNGNGSGDPSCDDVTKLWLRMGGTTTLVSASQRTVPDPRTPQNAAFQGASVDGGKVFFQTTLALTDDAVDGAANERLLYEYDVSTGTLTLLTPNSGAPPTVKGVVDLSRDGSRLYLIAQGALAPGATAGDLNLYTYANGQFTFIAALTNSDTLLAKDIGRQERMSDDGNVLVFASRTNITAYDSDGVQEIYRYDATLPTGPDNPQCISCPSSGKAATGDAFLTEDGGTLFKLQRSRNVGDGGRSAFFESPDALVPQDDNGVMDVYEWKDGQVHLISSGHGSDGSYFVDSANDGRDVFFTTSDQLVSQDTDVDPDIYDARVGGGFPAAPAGPAAACVGDSCQGQPSPPPALQDPGSASLSGMGDLPLPVVKRHVVKRVSNAQRLSRALRACKKRSKRARKRCESQARKRFPGSSSHQASKSGGSR